MANLQFPLYQKSLCEDLKKTFLKRSSDTDSTRSADDVVSEVSDMLSTDIAVYAEKLLKEMSGGNFELDEAEDGAVLTYDAAQKKWVGKVSSGYVTRGEWDDFISGTDADNVINRWSEVEKFLIGMRETDNLDRILRSKLDVDVFSEIFTALDSSGIPIDLSDRDSISRIATIRVNYGFWSVGFVSALGKSTGGDAGGGSGAGALYELVDVKSNANGDGVFGAKEGTALIYDGTHWVAGEAGFSETQLNHYLTTNGYLTKNERLDSWGDYDKTNSWWVLSAGLGYSLRTDIAILTDTIDELVRRGIYWSDIKNTPTTLNEYGITDAYTKSEVDELVLFEKVNIGTEENPIWAIHAKNGMGVYSDKFISALGVSGIGGTTGLYNRLDSWDSYSSDKSEWVLSAYLGNNLNVRVSVLETLKGGHRVVIAGSGNVITNVEETDDVLTFSKGNLAFSEIIDKPNTLKEYGITDGVNSFEISGEGNAFTGCHIDGHKITFTKGETFLPRATFDELFEKVNIGTQETPIYAIRAKYGFYSDGFVSAMGISNGAGSPGVSYERLDNWSDYTEGKSEWVLSAKLGNDLNVRVNELETARKGHIISIKGEGSVLNDVSEVGDSLVFTKGELPFSLITEKPTTLAGYGITDAYTKSEVDAKILFEKVNIGTTANPVYAIRAKDGMGVYSESFISALGMAGSSGGSPSYDRLDEWSSYNGDKAEWVLSAYLGNDLNTRLTAIEGSQKGHTINVSGKGSSLIDVVESGTTLTFYKGNISFAQIDDKPNTLGGYGIIDGVNSSVIEGSGNAFTSCTIDGHTITFSRNITFLAKETFDDLFEKVNIGTDTSPVYAIRAKYGFYSDSFISAMGLGSISSVIPYERLDSWNDYSLDKSEWVLSAYLGYDLNTRVTAIENSKKGHTISISGSGNVVTNVLENGNTLTFTKGDLSFASIIEKPTTLSGYGITDGVSGYSVQGTGNAFTDVSISGHTITFTKGGTFLLKATFDDLFEKVNVGTSDSPIYAIRAKYGLYSDSFITAMGYGSSSTGVFDRLDNWDDYDDVKATWVLSAYLGNTLNERVSYLESNPQGHTIIVNGSGNVLTNVVESGSKLTFTKGELVWSKIKDVPLGTANGLATLDASGKVPSAQLPSYVDDVLEYTNKASFPTTGESGKIYIDQTTNLTYRWGGSAYVEISQSLALGETSSTAYAGDKGKQNAADIAALQTGKADKATTLAGYGITDAYTKTQTYTKTEVNTKLTDGSVTKIGTKDVGSATLPIYLKAGVPTAVGTSLAVDITGNSATTSKLKTAVTLWGQNFDGSKAITGNLTNVGTITPTGEDLKVVGNLIVTGGIVMYADDGASIESGFAALLAAHIDGVTIKYNEAQQKIYSVMTGIKVNGTTYKPSETDGYITIPDYPTSLNWENIENKPSTFTPASHTHTFASLTSKPTTLSGYGITDAKIANGVITLGTATITPLTAHQTVTLASGTNNGTLKLTVNGSVTDNIAVKGLGSAAFTASSAYAAASHTHNYAGSASAGGAAYSANKINSRGNLTAYAEGSTTMGESGVNLYTVYYNGYPVSYGNLLHIYGLGAGQLLAEWCNSSTLGHLYYRSKRDNSNNGWSAWGKVAFVTDNVASASKWATARKITLTGSVTGEVSIDGSGNVTLATTTNHTHSYVPLSGGTMSGNLILKGGTSSDMTYAGNVHPYIRFDNNDSSQNVSLIFTDYDSYRAPAGLKLVGNQGNEWFEAADIYATTFHGALSGNAATATTASKLGTANVGSGTQHFYLNAGTATASTSTVGGTAKPMYLNAGVMTAISATVGSTSLPVYLNAGTITACSTTLGVSVTGNAATATTLQTARTLWGQSFNGSANISGNMSGVGQITFSALSGTNGRALLYQQMADNDYFRIYCGGTGNNGGYAEIATADDGTEPIYVRQYSGAFSSVVRTLTLLDGNGNTTVPGLLTAANGTVNGTLKVGAIPVTNSSTGVLKIDGNLIVTGGITMYSSDGSSIDTGFGQMLADYVDNETIVFTGNKLRALQTGTVKSIIMGSTTYTPNSSGVVTLPEKVTWANIEGKPSTFTPSSHTHTISQITNLQATLDGKAAASHTHSYLPLSGGTVNGRLLVNYGVNYSEPAIAINYYDGYTVGNTSIAQIRMGAPNLDMFFGLSPASQGYYGKVGYFMHIGTDCEFLWATTNWTKRMALECNSGNLWVAGSVTASSFVGNASSATNSDTVDGYHASGLVKFYLSPMAPSAPADSAKSWFTNTMPSASGAIVYNVPGLEKTIIAGKSSGAYGHMLQLNYDDNYLRVLRYRSGSWQSTDWEKISAGYADSAGNADTLDGNHASAFATAGHTHSYLPPMSYSTEGNTVKQHKDGLANAIATQSGGIGYNITVGASIISQWNNESATYYDSSVYSMIKIGGGYPGSTYGQWLLSSFNLNRIGIVGRNNNTWSTIKWLAFTDDTVANSDTCDGLHVHGGRNNEANKIVRTDGSGYIQCGYINSLGGNEANDSSPAMVWGTNGSDNYMRTYLTRALRVNYASSSGYASSAGNAVTSNFLNSVNRMEYGWSGLNYFNANLTAGCTAKTNDAPVSEWWHIMRFNHGNPAGYYTDLAIPFNSDSLYWKCVRVGSLAHTSWVKVLDSLNYNEYAPTKTGTGASGTWGISVSGNAATASKWATARTLTLSGSVTGSVSIDGSGNVTLATTTNHTHSYLPLSGGTMSNTNVVTNLNADTVDGYHAEMMVKSYIDSTDNFTRFTSRAFFQTAFIGGQGDFCSLVIPTWTGNSTNTYYTTELRFDLGSYSPRIRFTSPAGTSDWATLARTVDNVASASKWATARTLTLTGSVTGSVSIDGSGNVSLATTTNHTHSYLPLAGGTMTGTINANDNTQNTGIKFKNNNANLNALGNQHLILGTAIRFGAYGTWDWNVWAGLKYDSSSKTIYLGLADGTIFGANSAQSGGTLKFPGVSEIYLNSGTRISHGGSLYFGRSDNSGWLYFQDMASQNGTSYWMLTQAGYLTAKGVTLSEKFSSSVSSSTYLDANKGKAIINSTAAAGFNMLARMKSTNGVFIHGVYNNAYKFYYTGDGVISEGANEVSDSLLSLGEDGYVSSNNLVPLSNAACTFGLSSNRWLHGYFSSTLYIGAANSTATNAVANCSEVGAGCIELSHSTPYIDFHYGNSTGDYTSRIVATSASCLAITSNLYIGGSGASSYKLRVAGQTHIDGALESQGMFVVLGSAGPVAKIDQSGNITANGGITMYSDLRKKNILSNEVLSVKEIAAAPLFRHTYKSDDNQYIHVGTSAQYWSGIHEEWFTRKDDEGYYQMELQNLGVAMGISLAREIVKYESKTDKKIRLMKKKINDLEARIKELEGSMEERRTA